VPSFEEGVNYFVQLRNSKVMATTEEELAEVKRAQEELKKELDEARLQLRVAQEVERKMAAQSAKPVTVMPMQRRLERFKGHPDKLSDPTVQEWVADARAVLATYQGEKKDKASFLLQHLAGNARVEIRARPAVEDDPERILDIIERTFGDGDGDDLPKLQEKFYTFRQESSMDLLACSLELVQLHDKIVKKEPSLKASKEATLKGRLAEAVRDEGLRRELRRLNTESPDSTFFDLRDRAVRWLGPGKANQKVTAQELASNASLMKMLEDQQKQIAELKEALKGSGRTTPRRLDLTRVTCWRCHEQGHFKRDCSMPAAHDSSDQSTN